MKLWPTPNDLWLSLNMICYPYLKLPAFPKLRMFNFITFSANYSWVYCLWGLIDFLFFFLLSFFLSFFLLSFLFLSFLSAFLSFLSFFSFSSFCLFKVYWLIILPVEWFPKHLEDLSSDFRLISFLSRRYNDVS